MLMETGGGPAAEASAAPPGPSDSRPLASSTAPAPPRPSAIRRSIATPIVLLVCAGLAAFNAWWYRRDTRPVPGPQVVAGWIAGGQLDQAESAIREELRRSPRNGEARLMLAKLLAARGDLIGCGRELEKVEDWWPGKAEALYRAGQAYFQANRAKDAEAAWLAVIGLDPLHHAPSDVFHDAALELLKFYSTEDRWEDAFPVLWKAYEEASPVDHPILLSMRLRSEIERVAPTETIPVLTRYVAADPTDWEARRSLARAELALGHREQAEAHFKACLRGRPNDARAWRDYLTMLSDAGEFDALEAEIAKVPPSCDEVPEIWKLRGQMREKERDWAGAAAAYYKALEINPYTAGCHYRLSQVEQRLGHAEEAARYRKQTEDIREAQTQLRTAYNDFIAAQRGEKRRPDAPDLPGSLRQLAQICETLGWGRVAAACLQIAAAS